MTLLCVVVRLRTYQRGGAFSMSDTITPPWTIKGISLEVRNAAIEAARRDRRTQGEWLTRVILEAIKAERHAPSEPRELATVGPRELATVEPPEPEPAAELTTVVDAPAPQPELSNLERAVEIAGKLAAATGKPPPTTFTRPVYARLLAQAVLGQE